MVQRRKFMSTVAGAGAIGVAGCSSSDSDGTGSDGDSGGNSGGDSGGDSNDQGWPPSRSIIDVMVNTDPGGLIDILARIWFNEMEAQDAYPGDITTTVTNRPGAQGNVLMNELANNTPAGGGGLGAMRINSAIVNQIGSSQADFDLSDLRAVVRYSADTRAIQLNPRTTPVEDHFEFSWEDFQNLAQEQGIKFPYSNSAQLVFATYLRANDPVLNEDNWEFIGVSGGSASTDTSARTYRTFRHGTTRTTPSSAWSIPKLRRTSTTRSRTSFRRHHRRDPERKKHSGTTSKALL